MKTYLASYESNRGGFWDLEINAENYKEARRDAREQCQYYGRLWALRLIRPEKKSK